MPFFVLAGATIASAGIGALASNSAAKTQANATDQATALQQQQFATTTANEAPYVGAGLPALTAIQQGLGLAPGDTPGTPNGSLLTAYNTPAFTAADLQETPGYKFQVEQGLNAVENNASVGGIGGNTLKALTNYAEGAAGSDYWNEYNAYVARQQQALQAQAQKFGQLQTIAGSGQDAAAGLGALGAATATNIGNNITSGASATSAGQIGVANAASGAVNNLSQTYLLSNLLKGAGTGMNAPTYSI